MRSPQLCHVVFIALILPALCLAQQVSLPMESDWMELVTGHRDERTGTEVRSIESDGESGYQTITLAVPKKKVGSPDAIEEVVVIGRKPEKPEPLLDMNYEWLDDYEDDNYGLVIRLRKDTEWPIRLYVDSEAGFVNR